MRSLSERGIPHAPALQREFTRLARDVLAGHGRKLAGWEERVSTGLDGGELLFAWQEDVGVPAVRRTGNPWVYMDNAYLYFNRLAGPVATEPPGLDGLITPGDVLEAPIPMDDSDLLGVQAAVWCEFILDRGDLLRHLFPRLLSYAEIAWNGAGTTTWEEFEPRLRAEVEWLYRNAVPLRTLD